MSGQVLFSESFERESEGWHLQSLPGRARPSFTPFEGTVAARFEVRNGDVEPDTGSERSEVSGPTLHRGQDLYIRDAIRVPSGNAYRVPWQIVQQLHEEDWSGSPGIAVFLENNRSLKLGAGDSSPMFWHGPRLQPNRWYELVYRVRLSRNPQVGFVEVWLDGVQRVLANSRLRMYGRTIQAPRAYIKAGIYRGRSSVGTSVVEHDAIAIGTSLAAVRAG